MAAACAVCAQPIVHGQRFLLEGTEVFHARCVQASYRSKLKLTESRVRELERQLAGTRRSAARVEEEANRLRNEAAAGQARTIELEATAALERSLRSQASELAAARRDQLAAAAREIDALRAELAAMKPEQSEPDTADATVLRFKMLELD